MIIQTSPEQGSFHVDTTSTLPEPVVFQGITEARTEQPGLNFDELGLPAMVTVALVGAYALSVLARNRKFDKK